MKYISKEGILLLIFNLMFMVIFTSCASINKRGSDLNLTKETAIKVSNNKAKELNYNTNEMEIIFDDQNSEWNRYLALSKINEWQPELVAPLKDKDYWAIYYRPKKNQMGGDLWVFIDKQKGEVITVIQGE